MTGHGRTRLTSLSSDSVTQEVWFLTPSSPLSALHHGSCVLSCLGSLVFLTVFRAANASPVTIALRAVFKTKRYLVQVGVGVVPW